MKRLFFLILISLQATVCFSQYNWKLKKEGNGIKVYASSVENSSFKAIKVECTLTGTYSKLISILTNVPQFSNWIYHSKKSELLKQNSPHDIIYHTETDMPWPLTNRDAVIHIRINTDSLPAVMTIAGSSESAMVPKSSGKVRVQKYKASWRVTMPTPQTISIHYELEVDPGGSIPGWIANMFVDKGPYETFSKLGKKLKE